MKKYIQTDVHVTSQTEKDILIAELSELGFEGFEEERATLKAFINETEYNPAALESLMKKSAFNYSISIVEDKNWNAIWEAGFDPVIVSDFCAVRADFHTPVKDVQYEIIITPKMSFGTGHHATTYMMIEEMRNIDFSGKAVFDFGTGTGVLAILAEQLGAGIVYAIDNDDWSIDNAMENLLRNNSTKVQIKKADRITASEKFDIVLANINKHVILQQMDAICKALKPGGNILFSGLLSDDEGEVDQLAAKNELMLINKKEKHNWICLNYVSKS